jgi:hypothetical protein
VALRTVVQVDARTVDLAAVVGVAVSVGVGGW